MAFFFIIKQEFTREMAMKSLLILAFSAFLATGVSSAQLKSLDEQPVSASQSLVHPATSISSFLGLLNSDNFMMRHNFSLSYLSSGGDGISMASYTNSMFYRIADPLNLRLDLTLQGSPFGGSGTLSQGNFSKLYISRAQLNYKPADNMFLRLEYNQIPFGYLPGGYSSFAPGYYLGDE
jgi:opacity protein-like surface antigen